MVVRPKFEQEQLLRTYTYTVIKTPLGYLGAARTLLGLHTVILPKRTPNEVVDAFITKLGESAVEDEAGFSAFYSSILNYFSGKNVRFDEPLDVGDSTSFEKRVWLVAATIPWGQVRSYNWVAASIGQSEAWRAVGQALARNRLPIVIPCHRVIMKNGDIGGFVEGPAMKRLLLKVEGRVL